MYAIRSYYAGEERVGERGGVIVLAPVSRFPAVDRAARGLLDLEFLGFAEDRAVGLLGDGEFEPHGVHGAVAGPHRLHRGEDLAVRLVGDDPQAGVGDLVEDSGVQLVLALARPLLIADGIEPRQAMDSYNFV